MQFGLGIIQLCRLHRLASVKILRIWEWRKRWVLLSSLHWNNLKNRLCFDSGMLVRKHSERPRLQLHRKILFFLHVWLSPFQRGRWWTMRHLEKFHSRRNWNRTHLQEPEGNSIQNYSWKIEIQSRLWLSWVMGTWRGQGRWTPLCQHSLAPNRTLFLSKRGSLS